jgi:hypothetical protein
VPGGAHIHIQSMRYRTAGQHDLYDWLRRLGYDIVVHGHDGAEIYRWEKLPRAKARAEVG